SRDSIELGALAGWIMLRKSEATLAAIALTAAVVGCRESATSSSDRDGLGGDLQSPSEEAPAVWTPHTDMPDCRHVEVKADCRDGWCRIPAGCFVMGPAEGEFGAPPDEYRVSVVLTHAFEMQQVELTVQQWQEMGLAEPVVVAQNEVAPCL